MNKYEQAYNEIKGFVDIIIRLNEKGIRSYKKTTNIVCARMIETNLYQLKELIEQTKTLKEEK